MVNDNSLPWFVGAKALDVYLKPSKYLVLDFETTNLEYGSALNPDNHIVLACWEIVSEDGTITRKHVWGDEYEMSELERDIAEVDFIVAHNAKFELQWLKRCGLELRDILVFDTYLAEWVIAGNRSWELNLDATAKRYGLGAKLSLSAKCLDLGICPSIIPKFWLLPYCYKDVELCRKLYLQQRDILQRDGLLHLTLTRNLTCAVLADIEFNGCELDPKKVKEEYEQSVNDFQAVERELQEVVGSINLSSPKQLAAYLYDELGFDVPTDYNGRPLTTATGAPKTDTGTLSLLRSTTPEQERFLSLYKLRNKLDSLLTKNLEFFQKVCEQKKGIFYGVFNQGFTGTHRLSSSGRTILFEGLKKPKGVQLQNLPRQYKGLFTAHDEDYLVGEADGAQLEFRVAAEMGNDKVATEEIIGGADIHSVTSQVMIEAKHPKFIGKTVKEGRQDAKAHTFAPMYGGMGKHPAEKEYAKFFKAKYHGISGTQRDWCEEVLDRGYQINPYGMRFYWPGTKMSRSGYIENTTSISNYSIQGFATGEIIPIALVHFWHRTRGMPIIIWNTIHDSIASRVHKDVIEEYKVLSKVALTTDVYSFLKEVYEYQFTVPLGVGVKVAKHWGASKTEEVWAVSPDGEETYQKKD